MKKNFLIVGAGLYGCILARQLYNNGYSVKVIDKRKHIGGNCASAIINGIDIHFYGPHVFHTNKKDIWEYINQYTPFLQIFHKVLSYHNNKIYDFPINKRTIYDIHNSYYIPDLILNNNPKNFEEYAISKIGLKLYEIFIKDYTKKQWDCDPKELPVSIIKRIPIRDSYYDSYFDDYYQGVPILGYYDLFNNLLHHINYELHHKFSSSDKQLADKIIYTGPIDEYFNYTFGSLKWRSLKFNFKKENIQDFQGTSIIHYPELQYPYTRITEFKHFNRVNKRYNEQFTIYAEEIPCSNNDPYYPIEDEENIKKYNEYLKLAQKEKNVFFAGRLGSYKYNNMDITVENALNDFIRIQKGEIL